MRKHLTEMNSSNESEIAGKRAWAALKARKKQAFEPSHKPEPPYEKNAVVSNSKFAARTVHLNLLDNPSIEGE